MNWPSRSVTTKPAALSTPRWCETDANAIGNKQRWLSRHQPKACDQLRSGRRGAAPLSCGELVARGVILTGTRGKRHRHDTGGWNVIGCGRSRRAQTVRGRPGRQPVNDRPRAITLIGWLFIAVGGGGIARGLWDVVAAAAAGRAQLEATLLELWLMLVSGILAALSGALLLRGSAWGRWLLVAWMAGHIVLSALHDAFKLGVHAVLFAVVFYFLFRREASAYFQRERRPIADG